MLGQPRPSLVPLGQVGLGLRVVDAEISSALYIPG